MQPMIRVENLSKAYGARMALDRASFRVPAGHIVGLVGKNGAGKTTALRVLSGQLLPTEGEVWIDGHALSQEGIAIRAKIGYLPETPPLYPEMTVESYLAFACRLRGIAQAHVPSRIKDVAARTGLAGAERQRLGTLARGYRQRVGIAQAIVHDPPVVLLDEPLTGLDPLQIVQIRDLILALKPRHTVLFSSHILSEVTQVCDSVVLLDEGMVKAEGSEDQLRRDMLQRRTLKLLARGEPQALQRALQPLGGGNELKVRLAQGGAAGLAEAEITGREDVRERAAKLCVEAGLGLLELREVRHGLEALMRQLLEREQAA